MHKCVMTRLRFRSQQELATATRWNKLYAKIFAFDVEPLLMGAIQDCAHQKSLARRVYDLVTEGDHQIEPQFCHLDKQELGDGC